MALTGLAMQLHNRLRLLATLAGVLFAVLLSNFALGTFLGLLQKNLFLPDNMQADIWIVPKGLRQLGQGDTIPYQAALTARGVNGVESTTPILLATRAIDTLRGQKEAIQLIGVPPPYKIGGPWNLVAGSPEVLGQPDHVILESSMRDQYGNLNLQDVRELNGHRAVVGGFTSGLLPFGAAYGFADYDFAREILSVPRDKTSFVLVSVHDKTQVTAIQAVLRRELADVDVLTKGEMASVVIRYILTATPIGVTFGAISFFGVLVGTVIVSLTMFQAVVDNLKEFGTLKALGANMWDLSVLLYTQALVNACIGSLLGVSLVAAVASLMRSPKLALQLPPLLTGGTFVVMTGVCLFAATLALMRLRKVEPAMVFR